MDKKIEKIAKDILSLSDAFSDIKAIVSIGSFSQESFDIFSDVDLYLFTSNPNNYLESWAWTAFLGKSISTRRLKDKIEQVDKIKLVLEGGLMYDITIIDYRRFKLIKYFLFLKTINCSFILPKKIKKITASNINRFCQTIQRGYSIHYDRISLNKILSSVKNLSTNRPTDLPDKEAFLDCYNCFMQSCYTSSIKLIRGEFFHNVIIYDKYMKQELLRVMEWSALIRDKDADIYFNGIKVHQWAGKDVYNELLETLPQKNPREMQERILKSINLFRHFSIHIATFLNINIDYDFENFLSEFIRNNSMRTSTESPP